MIRKEKIMKKQFLALLLCVAMFLMSIPVGYANNMDDVYSQAPDYYTPEYQAELRETIAAMNAYIQSKTMARSGAQKFLSVQLEKQATEYYCGPASALMIIKFKNSRTTLTQKILAGSSYCAADSNGLTTAATMTQALNKALGSGTYKYIQTKDQSFSSALIYSVDKGYPVACNVHTEYLPAYAGARYGHWVVATGYSYGFTAQNYDNDVRYNDPHYDERYYCTYTISWEYMSEAISKNYDYYVAKS